MNKTILKLLLVLSLIISNIGFSDEFGDAIIKEADKAIELNPNDAAAYFLRGFFKSNLKDYEEAIIDFNKSIELKPNDAMSYSFRGEAKSNLKDYKGAIIDFNKSIELAPDYAKAYLNRGNAKYYLKDYEEALKDLEKVKSLDNNLYYSNEVDKIIKDIKNKIKK